MIFKILFLCSIILLFLIKKRNLEKFTNYKKIIIKPQNSVYNKTTINMMDKKNMHLNIGENISNIFPIPNINTGCSGLSAISNTNNYDNNLCLVSDEIYFYYESKNNNHNIRFICSLGYEQFTLITPFNSDIKNWNDIKNKKIGTIVDSSSFFIVQKILTAFNLKTVNKVLTIKYESGKIIKAFKDKIIDCYFVLTSHPDKTIQTIHRHTPLKIIGIEGLDKKILSGVFSFYNFEKVNLENYKLNHIIETLNVKLNLLCNKNFNKKDCYSLLSAIFSQFQYIKRNGDSDYLSQMRNFNPSKLYLDNLKYTYHDGTYKFLKDIGMITNNKSYYCKFKAGVENCKIEKINHFRLL
jgi:TRAP-type uncharacterized transport system substrate-binding protein